LKEEVDKAKEGNPTNDFFALLANTNASELTGAFLSCLDEERKDVE
jgi:hypothetical protein